VRSEVRLLARELVDELGSGRRPDVRVVVKVRFAPSDRSRGTTLIP
jgi:hypothetical protein